jgi:hypothetical protein
MYSQDSSSSSSRLDACSEAVWPCYSSYHQTSPSDGEETVCTQSSFESFNWNKGVETPLPKLSRQQPALVSFGSLEDDQFIADEREALVMPWPQEQPKEEISCQQGIENALVAGPKLLSFLKVLCIYLERADPKLLRDVKQTINVCCIQKQLKVPQFASLAEALERELKAIVGERYWRRIQMYHREICNNLHE